LTFNAVKSLVNQQREACLNPESDFFNLHTLPGVETWKPGGNFI